ncbi:MAG: bifunctional 4-hydroxy-3-methylbut-2-enyl diphosphate reductase/30S ribosomal protein S1 [Oscillospiraceae bacterium]|nr:bifunctional 4-hydroxy-3-methylbut-2-enyl diphosphate reductase/30S ribosomal protein S1 [Oscillospiraceae bacterium]
MKRIVVAKSAGFCFGVSRSVSMAEKLLEEGKAYSLGPLIHNNDVVTYLEQKGLSVIDTAEQLPPGGRVIIRSHGISKEVYGALEEKNAKVCDATCPKVNKIHELVSEASAEGRFVVIIGMHGHPEVEAVGGWCGEHVICDNVSELSEFFNNNTELLDKPITMVVQTTQTRSNFTECANFLKKMCTNHQIFDTICGATSMRQEEAAKIAALCGAMVVIGGEHSANSVHLAEICRRECDNVQFISKADELDMDRLSGVESVGITAGASTPSWIIKEVSNKMSEEIKIDAAAAEEREMSFDEMLEESIKTIYNGDKVTGCVIAITGTEISVDIGAKYSGFIPTTEFTDDGINVEDAVKVGDTIEAVVVRVNDVEGTVMLSKKRLDAAKSWTAVEEAVENGNFLEGVVTEENKGGIVVSVKGVRVFVPASQSGLPKEADMSQLLKQKVRVKITEVNRGRKRVVGSIRAVAQKERRERAEAIWNEMEVGNKYHGTVKSMTSYGAFVDIGGIDGMVHVSEMSWGRIKNPAEMFSIGDEVDVYVISFDREKRKISLGYKDPAENPWIKFTSTYNVGDTAEVKIVKLMTFGAFAEVLPGVDGLIHISQIANRRIGKPEEVLTVGDVVEAKITAIDMDNHKISLSIRALAEPAAQPVAVEEESGEDALVYEVSTDGEATGDLVEE